MYNVGTIHREGIKLEKESVKGLHRRWWFWAIIAVLAIASVIIVFSVQAINIVDLANNRFTYNGTSYEKYSGSPWTVVEDEFDIFIAKDKNLNLNVYVSKTERYNNIALVKENQFTKNPATIYCEEDFNLSATSSENVGFILVDITQGQTDFQRKIIDNATDVVQLVDALERDHEDITDLINYVCTLYLVNKDNACLYIWVEVLQSDAHYYLFNTVDGHSVILSAEEVKPLLSALEDGQN